MIDKYGGLVARRPLGTYCCNCGAFVFIVLVCLALGRKLGEDFFNYQMDVPLYLRGNPWHDVDDALFLAREGATLPGAGEETEVEKVKPELERSKSTWSRGSTVAQLIFVAPDEDGIYTFDRLKLIYEIQQRIEASEFYRENCLLMWPRETIERAEQEMTREEVLELATNRSALPECAPIRTQFQACVPRPGLPCSSADARPVGLLNCPKAAGPCEKDELEPLDQAFIADKLEQAWDIDPFLDRTSGTFFSSVAADFGTNSNASFSAAALANVKAMTIVYQLGVPLRGFNSSKEAEEEQSDLLGLAGVQNFSAVVDAERAALQEVQPGMELWADSPNLRNAYIQPRIMLDVSFAIFSFIFVYIFMTIAKKSLWLSTMGMGMLLLAFGPAYLMYWGLLGQSYFGIFNLLSVFIILGIGADDIFVFTDTFDHSIKEGPMIKRMPWTLRRAGGAMLVTSLTTMASFLATARSEFPGISTFGSWAAMLVLANYIAVITFYPTAVSVYEAYTRRARCWCTSCLGEGSVEVAPAAGTSAKATHDGRIVHYFRTTHADFIDKFKVPIVVCFLAFVGVAGYFAANIEVDPDPPAFFSRGHNMQEFPDARQDYFSGGVEGSHLAVRIGLVHGFDRDLVDRTGTNRAIPTDRGSAVYHDFDLRATAPCLLEICERFNTTNEELFLRGGGRNTIYCWVNDLYAHYLQVSGNQVGPANALWRNATTGTDEADEALWQFMLAQFVRSPAFASHTSNLLLKEGEGGLLQGKVSVVQVRTDQEYNVHYDKGQAFVEGWNATLQRWVAEAPECAAVKDVPVFTTAPRFGASFYMSEALLQEAFSGILLSLLMAYAILTVFSGNLIVATIAIFCIASIVVCVMGYVVMSGQKLGMLQSINLVFTPGLSVDFIAHLAEGYIAEAHANPALTDRKSRMTASLTAVGISVISGAFSTAGSCAFLFFPEIVFFVMFGTFIFVTISLSLLFSLVLFAALMMLVGPEGERGSILALCSSSKSASSLDPRP